MVQTLDLEVLGVRKITSLIHAVSFEFSRAHVVICMSFLMLRLFRLHSVRLRWNVFKIDNECLMLQRPRTLPALFEREVFVHDVF